MVMQGKGGDGRLAQPCWGEAGVRSLGQSAGHPAGWPAGGARRGSPARAGRCPSSLPADGGNAPRQSRTNSPVSHTEGPSKR